jgi:hypothetical protein
MFDVQQRITIVKAVVRQCVTTFDDTMRVLDNLSGDGHVDVVRSREARARSRTVFGLAGQIFISERIPFEGTNYPSEMTDRFHDTHTLSSTTARPTSAPVYL